MSVDLTSLQSILDEIPDKGRRQRLWAKWKDEAMDVRDDFRRERTLIELLKKSTQTKMNAVHTQADERLTSKQACDYLKIGMTMFIAYKNAGLIQVENQIGNKHLFSRKHLDNFLQIPAHQRNMLLANAPPKEPRWGRKKKSKADAKEGSSSLRIEHHGNK